MTKKSAVRRTPSPLLQFVINFVLPIIVLTKFSADDQLGPIYSMLVALAFPIVFELFSIYKRNRPSYLSLIAIGGIVVTGSISLLGLSEGWLALRRSIPYFALSAAIIVSIHIKRPLFPLLLTQILDMERINTAAVKHAAKTKLDKHIRYTGYFAGGLFLLIGITSYWLTRSYITAATGSTDFNQEYARLRVMSVFTTTLPLFIGCIALIMYLIMKIEKLTGITLDDLPKKKRQE